MLPHTGMIFRRRLERAASASPGQASGAHDRRRTARHAPVSPFAISAGSRANHSPFCGSSAGRETAARSATHARHIAHAGRSPWRAFCFCALRLRSRVATTQAPHDEDECAPPSSLDPPALSRAQRRTGSNKPQRSSLMTRPGSRCAAEFAAAAVFWRPLRGAECSCG